MQQLTNAEEQLMEHLGILRNFMKDLSSFPEPKPKTTTVATLLKEWLIKILYTEFGNSENTIH
jgi:hypothetical protein